MFRAIAYYLDSQNINVEDDKRISKSLAEINFQFAKSSDVLVEINNIDLTHKIREHHVSALASKYSQSKVVREYLKDLQRSIAKGRPSILEGRDIGTVVFPNAALKFYLTADNAIRAKRRFLQIKEKDPSTTLSVDSLLKDIQKRDADDQNRKIAPLQKAHDATELDSTNMSIDKVVDIICEAYQKKKEKF